MARGLARHSWFVALLAFGGCATAPPAEIRVVLPSHISDSRGRFGEIYCSVLQARATALPDYRSCAAALSKVANSPPGTGRAVDLGFSHRGLVAAIVPGLGYACLSSWLEPMGTVREHVRQFGFDMLVMDVDPLSGTATNARRIRDAILSQPVEPVARFVLIGYSKGAPDILEAIASYPDIRGHVAAVVSLAGAIMGSPLAEDAEQAQADVFRRLPKADCEPGDGEGVASLRPDVRRAWLANNPPPSDVRFYSVVTLPDPGRVSRILKPSYRKLAAIDTRNDSQLVYTDQIVPGSSLLAFVNADHLAAAVALNRSHPLIARLLVNHNDYPREALLEAVLRFVEEDLATRNQ